MNTQPTRSRPWTRWWWMASAVTPHELTRHLQAYASAGIGGVEITPVYGAKGAEHLALPLLSDAWVSALRHTLMEGNRLGIGVDMTLGSGWPYGGPHLSEAHAPRTAAFHRQELTPNATAHLTFPGHRIECAAATLPDGSTPVPSTPDTLSYTAPATGATLDLLLSRPTRQQVKRAAPGGQGHVMCPYTAEAFDAFIAPYTRLLSQSPARPRCVFYDSFEVFGADFATGLPDRFFALKGYALATQLPALAGHAESDLVARIRCDYRDVLFHCLLDQGIAAWVHWAHRLGIQTRYQAHGAPGNLLDLYAAADIPETEVFGTNHFAWQNLGHHPEVVPPEYPLVNKFASSAAHLTNKPLVSSETFTWLREHFHSSLADLKPEADQLFLTGINHLFFHGSTYSPGDAPWPGWLFYAATHFDITDPLWHDLPEFNRYVEFCQKTLQSSRVDNDLLVYFPFHDVISRPQESLFMQLSVHGVKGFIGDMPWGQLALSLWNAGYGFDFISDRLLATTDVSRYRALLLPPCQTMPLSTLRELLKLARAGLPILLSSDLPTSEPGLAGSTPSPEFTQLRNALARLCTRSSSPTEILARHAIHPNPATLIPGLRALRLQRDGQTLFFISNLSAHPIDAFLPFPAPLPPSGWALTDPLRLQAGQAAARRHLLGSEIYLQLKPGQSLWLHPNTMDLLGHTPSLPLPAWPYRRDAGAPIPLTGPWHIEPLSGGPALPQPTTTDTLSSWTDLPNPLWRDFSGTARYTLHFDFTPTSPATAWLLRFPSVGESVRITLNHRPVGTLWCHPFELDLTTLLRFGQNELVCEVTNLAANRIAAMDRQGIPWRIFHDINFANLHYTPFDASRWPTTPSGLLATPLLQPCQRFLP